MREYLDKMTADLSDNRLYGRVFGGKDVISEHDLLPSHKFLGPSTSYGEKSSSHRIRTPIADSMNWFAGWRSLTVSPVQIRNQLRTMRVFDVIFDSRAARKVSLRWMRHSHMRTAVRS